MLYDEYENDVGGENLHFDVIDLYYDNEYDESGNEIIPEITVGLHHLTFFNALFLFSVLIKSLL